MSLHAYTEDQQAQRSLTRPLPEGEERGGRQGTRCRPSRPGGNVTLMGVRMLYGGIVPSVLPKAGTVVFCSLCASFEVRCPRTTVRFYYASPWDDVQARRDRKTSVCGIGKKRIVQTMGLGRDGTRRRSAPGGGAESLSIPRSCGVAGSW